jgi:hypothetical protein
MNFGTDVAAPIVTRQVEGEADTKATAETDAVSRGSAGHARRRASSRSTATASSGAPRRRPTAPSSLAPALVPAKQPKIDGGTLTPEQDAASFAEAPAAGASDIVDQAVSQIMADEGWIDGKPPIAAHLVDELAKASARRRR